MQQQLRDYQVRALQGLRARWRENPILCAPTGSGKTTICAHLVAGAIEKGKRVLFLCHRKELVEQAAVRFLPYVPMVGIIKAGFTSTPLAPVQVATVQTLVNRERPPADIVVIDECHHAAAETYQTILGWYPDACRIGLTATPFRTDGQGLGCAGFGALVIAATPGALMAEGSLLEPRVFRGVELPDLKGVKIRQGDYAPGELALRVDRPKLVTDIVEAWQTHAGGRLTVCFAASVEHSRHVAEAFTAAGVRAEHLDGKTPLDDRDAILRRFNDGATVVISNYGVLTEGWDVPAAGICILARPTESLGLYLQMAGRVMRPLPGKARPIILDHAGCTEKHGMVTQEIEYSLDGVHRKSVASGVKTCPSCFALVPSSTRVCPECGHQWTPAEKEPPEVVPGTMVEVTEDIHAWYADQVEEAAARGRKIGFARYRFKERFGRWPALYAIEKRCYRPFEKPLSLEHLAVVYGDGFEEACASNFGIDVDRQVVEWKDLAAIAAWIKRGGEHVGSRGPGRDP